MAYLLLCVTIFWALATSFCTYVFLKHHYFSHLRVFVLLLSELSSLLCLKRLVFAKLFTKLGCCRILCHFLSGQVVNCSQRSLTMLLSKLTLDTAKPLTHPEEVLTMGPCSATDDGPPCLSLVPYPKRAIRLAYVSVVRVCSLNTSLTVSGGSLCLELLLLLGTFVGRRELLPTPLRDAHWMSRLQEKCQQKCPT
jgi:hypothetical protein